MVEFLWWLEGRFEFPVEDVSPQRPVGCWTQRVQPGFAGASGISWAETTKEMPRSCGRCQT